MATAWNGRPTWHGKLHPQFFEQAAVYRDFEVAFARIQAEYEQGLRELGKTATSAEADTLRGLAQKARGELLARSRQRFEEISSRYGDVEHNRTAYHYLDAPPDEPNREAMGFARYLHWLRHRESLAAADHLDREGDLDAFGRITRTAEDFRRIVHQKGGLKPFQGDVQHREMLELIYCFERQPLTGEERAACMDECCPCGKEHDADALKKQWHRLKKDLGL
jgi:hypothetical protein